MNIPSSVRIVGTDYPITMESRLNNGEKLAYGHIDYEQSQMQINPDYSRQQQEETFLHEVIHGICDKLKIKTVNDDEDVVDGLATGLYAFIKDNPDVFKEEK